VIVRTAIMTNDCCSSNSLQRIHQPRYSMDLTPSDFHSFGKVKGDLSKDFIADDDNLLTQVTAILEGICQDELNRVFGTGSKRLGM
jgi:hypothetical protein